MEGTSWLSRKMEGDASKEVNLLKKINHFNLIKLQGYCQKDGCFYLVFEYMENGNLREWLNTKSSLEHQSWAKRIQIALDIANGLQYLHNFIEPCYVQDINSGNILLNRGLRAKIANFALDEESERKITTVYPTSHVVECKGYTALEYLEAGMVTTKVDVYAFGMMLLEFITGKYMENAEEKLSLFIDPYLTGNSGKVCGLQLGNICLACLNQEPATRPNMTEVVSSLLKIYERYESKNITQHQSQYKPREVK